MLNPSWNYAFNHDGFGILEELASTEMTEADAENILVRPLADSCITLIDWCILTTGQHNCRTRHGRAFSGDGQGRDCDFRIGRVVTHYNAQPRDLFDIVIARGHAAGMRVFGNIRPNHGALNSDRLLSCPGRNFGYKKDFRDPVFHTYLCELAQDILAKGADGISLDFERKTPFFPKEATASERSEAVLSFLRQLRRLTGKPVLARVSHDRARGEPEGQQPEQWMREGLIDIIVPATSNHDPDTLDWGFDRFVEAARQSPRPCLVWPQIWPTAAAWKDYVDHPHTLEAIAARVMDIRQAGGNGVYFFNFCCGGSRSPFFEMFRNLPR